MNPIDLATLACFAGSIVSGLLALAARRDYRAACSRLDRSVRS